MVAPAAPETAAAWRALESVPDPEIPEISVVDLGIVRAVEKRDGAWHVTITPTYSGCPAYEVMQRDMSDAMHRAGLVPVTFTRALDPPWTTDWLSDRARDTLRRIGIAPPDRLARGKAHVTFVVPCPRCGSSSTETIARFGATACKALHRCLACREPFEHFKPI